MNFGIVGTGLIAEFHAKALAEIPGAKLVACLDKFPERAAQYAQKNGCAAYDDLGKFLAHPGLDIVNICTPSGLHMDVSHLQRRRRGSISSSKSPRNLDGALRKNSLRQPIAPA